MRVLQQLNMATRGENESKGCAGFAKGGFSRAATARRPFMILYEQTYLSFSCTTASQDGEHLRSHRGPLPGAWWSHAACMFISVEMNSVHYLEL